MLKVSTEQSRYASHWTIFAGNVSQGPVHSLEYKSICHSGLIHYDCMAVIGNFGQCCPPLDGTHGHVHSSDIEWNLESGMQSASTHEECCSNAVARAMCPRDHTVDKMRFMRKVLPVPHGVSTKTIPPWPPSTKDMNLV